MSQASNPAVLDLEDGSSASSSFVPSGRTWALRALLALAVLAVCGLVAVGVAIGATSLSQPEPARGVSPLRLTTEHAGTSRTAADSDSFNTARYGKAQLAKMRATFDGAAFRKAIETDEVRTFVWSLPGLDAPLHIDTMYISPEHGSYFLWKGHVQNGDATDMASVVVSDDIVKGVITSGQHMWQISGTLDDVVVTLVDLQEHNKRLVPFSASNATQVKARAAPAGVQASAEFPYAKLQTTPPKALDMHARIDWESKSQPAPRKRDSSTRTYETIRVLLLFNKNTCNSDEASDTVLLKDQLKLAWKTEMGMPEAEVIYACYKYASSTVLADLFDTFSAIRTCHECWKLQVEMGADLIMGVADVTEPYGGGATVAGPRVNGVGVTNRGATYIATYTFVHELGHFFGLDHNRAAQIISTCAPTDPSCARAGEDPNNNYRSLMSYPFNLLGSCNGYAGSTLWTAANYPPTRVPVYSGYNYNGVLLGDSSCTTGSNYNRQRFTTFFNTIAAFQPDRTYSCNSAGCQKTWSYPTCVFCIVSGDSWVQWTGNTYGGKKFYITRWEDFDGVSGTAHNLQQMSNGLVKQKPAVRNKDSQIWTSAYCCVTSLSDGTLGGKYRFSNKQYPDYRLSYNIDSKTESVSFVTGQTNPNIYDAVATGTYEFTVWCLQNYPTICVVRNRAAQFLEATSSTNEALWKEIELDYSQLWIIQETSGTPTFP